MAEDHLEIKKRIEQSENQNIPEIYFNGFASNIGAGDIFIVLERNQSPVARLNISYSVAKTLALKLNGLIQTLENTTSHNIMTVDDIAKAFAKKFEK